MFSLEEMLEITGDVQWADYLERVAYNALPTQVTDDYSARQYYQQTNQVAVTRGGVISPRHTMIRISYSENLRVILVVPQTYIKAGLN